MTTGSTFTTSTDDIETRRPAALEDDIYDDACDLGQFFLNPCWFLFVKTQKALDRSNTKKTTSSLSLWPHAAQQAFYYLLTGSGWTVIFTRVYPMVSPSDRVADYHKTFGYILFAAVVTSCLYAKTTPPGTITADSAWRFDNYPYDNILYTPSEMLMGVPKLARSKYDRYSKQHVARFDHFCSWLGTPIGEENYRYFLAFVLVHTAMALYGSIIVFVLLSEQGAQSTTSTSSNALTAAVAVDPLVALFCLLMGMGFVPLSGFSAFHAYLVYKGMTTNEFFKWRVIRRQQQQQPTNGNDNTNPSPIYPTRHYYNLGLGANIHEVLFPRSLRGDTSHGKES